LVISNFDLKKYSIKIQSAKVLNYNYIFENDSKEKIKKGNNNVWFSSFQCLAIKPGLSKIDGLLFL